MSEQSAEEPERIGQSLFNSAVATRDPVPVVDRLNTIGIDQERVEGLAGLIRRSGALIFQRPDSQGQQKRDDFLDTIRAFVATNGASLSLAKLDGAISTMRVAERGHHLILSWRTRCAFADLPLPVRIAAAVARIETELKLLQTAIGDALAAPGAQLSVPGGIMLRRENGQPLDPNAAHTSLVYALGGTLKMEAFAHKLFDSDGRIVLPELSAASDDEIFKVGADMMLGMFWHRWAHCHETARYLGEDLIIVEREDLPADADPRVKAFFTREPKANYPDWAANLRSADRESYSAAELMTTTNLADLAKSIDGTVALMPAEWISAEEVGHSVALSEALGYDVSTDQERLGGLRLVHWIRGLTALSVWAAAHATSGGAILSISEHDLINLLTRMSLTKEEATLFLDAVSYSKGSRDLYDAPIVRTKGDWLIVGTAVSGQRLSKIIPSMLAARSIVPKHKGTAFEERLLAFFKGQKLDAKAVTVKRGGEEYQYDVLLRWDGFLFLFECKNRGLSNNEPQAAFYFMHAVASDIEQVKRLAQALEDYPDILADAFGAGTETLTVVPVVLHNDTFQLKGEWDGVYVYDWSALTRFFKEGAFHATRLHRVNGKPVGVRAALKRIWKCDTPTPDDLLAELDDPHQLMLMDKLSEWQPSEFQLDEETVVRDWALVRRPMTEQNMAAACGVPYEDIAAQLDEGGAKIAELREKLAAAGAGGELD